ncbi:MAG: hypothetical protein R2879_08790 [Saprospiraceae bacterium]
MNSGFENVQNFAFALDADDFETAKFYLSSEAVYYIGNSILKGKEEIGKSYETNMLEGRAKLDNLIWGESRIQLVSNESFIIHFTDFLTHKNLTHVHRCEQKVWINSKLKIIKIEHLSNPKEEIALLEFYKKVGLA